MTTQPGSTDHEDERWLDALRSSSRPQSADRAALEGRLLREALLRDDAKQDLDSTLHAMTRPEAVERNLQQTLFKLRRDGVLDTTRSASRLWIPTIGIAAAALLVITLMSSTLFQTQIPIVYDPPPMMRGDDSRMVSIASSNPRADAEELLRLVRNANEWVAIYQDERGFIVDFQLEQRAQGELEQALSRLGAATSRGQYRVIFKH